MLAQEDQTELVEGLQGLLPFNVNVVDGMNRCLALQSLVKDETWQNPTVLIRVLDWAKLEGHVSGLAMGLNEESEVGLLFIEYSDSHSLVQDFMEMNVVDQLRTIEKLCQERIGVSQDGRCPTNKQLATYIKSISKIHWLPKTVESLGHTVSLARSVSVECLDMLDEWTTVRVRM